MVLLVEAFKTIPERFPAFEPLPLLLNPAPPTGGVCLIPKLNDCEDDPHWNALSRSGSRHEEACRSMRTLVVICLLLIASCRLPAEDSCMTIHGRAHLYDGDGQLRIRHVGTHHDYTPDDSSRGTVIGWLDAGLNDTGQHAPRCRATDFYLSRLYLWSSRRRVTSPTLP